MAPVILSWSGGKDSALSLARLKADTGVDVVGLVTTVTSEYDRVSIHGVRRSLLREQAAALDLPVHEIELQPQSSNDAYEAAWQEGLKDLPRPMREARHIAFGDIFLEDVREYRQRLAGQLGYETTFPLWGESTRTLADQVVESGIVATIVCVDTEVMTADVAGQRFDATFVASLPAAIDPCGERGEFHTFVSFGPGFDSPVAFTVGETVVRDERFAFCDLLPAVTA